MLSAVGCVKLPTDGQQTLHNTGSSISPFAPNAGLGPKPSTLQGLNIDLSENACEDIEPRLISRLIGPRGRS